MNYGGGSSGYSGKIIGIVDSRTKLEDYEAIICKIPFTEKYIQKTDTFVQNKEELIKFKEPKETFEKPKSKDDFPAREFKTYKKINREFKK